MESPTREPQHHQLGRPRIEIWEPTYRMTPKEGTIFQPYKVETILKSRMNLALDGFVYDHDKAKELMLQLTTVIKDDAKNLGFERYKIIVHVSIGEVRGQGIRIASRCLWDDKTDNCASYSIKNETTWAVATVFGIYLE